VAEGLRGRSSKAVRVVSPAAFGRAPPLPAPRACRRRAHGSGDRPDWGRVHRLRSPRRMRWLGLWLAGHFISIVGPVWIEIGPAPGSADPSKARQVLVFETGSRQDGTIVFAGGCGARIWFDSRPLSSRSGASGPAATDLFHGSSRTRRDPALKLDQGREVSGSIPVVCVAVIRKPDRYRSAASNRGPWACGRGRARRQLCTGLVTQGALRGPRSSSPLIRSSRCRRRLAVASASHPLCEISFFSYSS